MIEYICVASPLVLIIGRVLEIQSALPNCT